MNTTSRPSVLDDLLDLLDEPEPSPEANAEPEARSAVPRTQPEQPQAAAEVIDLAEAREERERLRQALTTKALRAAHQAIDVITETFEAKGGDFDDAVKALPVLHKVLEHVERLEVAKKTASTFTPANFVIVLDDHVPQTPPPRRARPLAGADTTVVDSITAR